MRRVLGVIKQAGHRVVLESRLKWRAAILPIMFKRFSARLWTAGSSAQHRIARESGIDRSSGDGTGPIANGGVHGVEWRREASTMAFYVAVCLVAALAAIDDSHRVSTAGIIWGTTIGLALAHLFAFRLAARFVGGGRVDKHERSLAIAQLTGAAIVAATATIPVIVFTGDTEVDATRLFLAALVGVPAFITGKSNGASTLRSASFAGVVLLVAAVIAVVKNVLLGH